MPQINKNGNFSFDDSGEQAGDKNVSLELDTNAVPGLADFEEGDQVKLSVTGKLGAIDQDGMASIEVSDIQTEPMNVGAKKYREMIRKPKAKDTYSMQNQNA